MLPARLLLWFAFILAVSCEYPPGPTPYCSSRQILPLLPLAISEVITVDVSDYFSGYNIDIILQPNNFSYLRPKYNKQAENKTKLDTPISMELKHSGNAWSSDFTVPRLADLDAHEKRLRDLPTLRKDAQPAGSTHHHQNRAGREPHGYGLSERSIAVGFRWGGSRLRQLQLLTAEQRSGCGGYGKWTARPQLLEPLLRTVQEDEQEDATELPRHTVRLQLPGEGALGRRSGSGAQRQHLHRAVPGG